MEPRRYLDFTNPATGATFGQVPMALPAEARQAVEDMRAAGRWWSRMSVRERVRALRRLQAAMIDMRDEIAAVINQDCGKSMQDALIEVFVTANMLDEYCAHAEGWLRPEPVSRGLYLFKRAYIEHRPYGVVVVIAPWNYPFALSLPPVFAALLAGNTVVLKPSEVTGATGVVMEKLLTRVPELANFVRVAHGDGVVGAALIEARPDFVFLTGSTATGKRVMRAAAEHMIPVTCELGGKDPLIVLEDADVAAAAKWAVWGAFFNTGQTCMAVERAYVVGAVYDRFVAEVLAQVRELSIGYSPEKDNPHYLGPMTFPRQVEIVRHHLEDAVARGAQVVYGGHIEGMFVEPTVLLNVDHQMLLMHEETFGPLLPIVKVADEAEAIRLANDSKFGLGASVWSQNIPRAERVARELQAGSVLVNDTICQFAVPMLPFGGVKESGLGRIHGRAGLMQFTQPHAYLVGQPPHPLDVATILRKPGHYQTAANIMRLAFGATLRQRLEPVREWLRPAGPEPGAAPKLNGRRAGLLLGAVGLLTAGAFLALRRDRRG